MLEKTVYVADDGKEFETEEECVEYEQHSVIESVLKGITLYDEYEEKTIANFINLEDFHEKYENSRFSFLIIKDCVNEDNLLEFENIFYYRFGMHIPQHTGVYCWDNDTEEWVTFEEDMARFMSKWEKIFPHMEIKRGE